MSREKFESMLMEQAFIEQAEFSGNLYGTSNAAIGAIESSGKRCVLDIDSQARPFCRFFLAGMLTPPYRGSRRSNNRV